MLGGGGHLIGIIHVYRRRGQNGNEGRKEEADGPRKQGLLVYERRKKQMGQGEGERGVEKLTDWISSKEGVEENNTGIMQGEGGE